MLIDTAGADGDVTEARYSQPALPLLHRLAENCGSDHGQINRPRIEPVQHIRIGAACKLERLRDFGGRPQLAQRLLDQVHLAGPVLIGEDGDPERLPQSRIVGAERVTVRGGQHDEDRDEAAPDRPGD